MSKRKPNGYWTLERCKAEALKHQTRTAWRGAPGSGYHKAYASGWLDECCEHMASRVWTLERCIQSASKHESRADWIRHDGGAYGAARNNGWLDECCNHMVYIQKPAGYWTKERCMASAAKYERIAEWQVNDLAGYSAARRRGWIRECCTHMPTVETAPPGYWSKQRCIESAAKYRSRREWSSAQMGAYLKAQRSGWIEDCCAHMEDLKKPNGYWTKELCMEEALKYTCQSDWRKNDAGSYQSARSGGFIADCTVHMAPLRKPSGHWLHSKENCIEDAMHYKTRAEWMRVNSRAYSAALTNGWIDECTAHMEYNLASDNDTVYIWRAVNEYYNSKPVYKVGVTSERLGHRRIYQVNKDAEIVYWAPVVCKATELERKLLSIGNDPKYATGDGRTEFRAMSGPELKSALSLIRSHQHPRYTP